MLKSGITKCGGKVLKQLQHATQDSTGSESSRMPSNMFKKTTWLSRQDSSILCSVPPERRIAMRLGASLIHSRPYGSVLKEKIEIRNHTFWRGSLVRRSCALPSQIHMSDDSYEQRARDLRSGWDVSARRSKDAASSTATQSFDISTFVQSLGLVLAQRASPSESQGLKRRRVWAWSWSLWLRCSRCCCRGDWYESLSIHAVNRNEGLKRFEFQSMRCQVASGGRR